MCLWCGGIALHVRISSQWNMANHINDVLKHRTFFRVIFRKDRKCNTHLPDDTPCLRYSVPTDSVYCCYYELFGNDSTLKMRTSGWSNIDKVIISAHHS